MTLLGQPRKRTAAPVRLLRAESQPLTGTLLDISASGAFVEVEPAPDVGTAVEVELLATAGALRLRGQIVRTGQMKRELHHPAMEHLIVRVPGVGLRFDALAAEQRLRLGQFLSTLEEG
ncbi:MAG: PilZ domain-containing protein [Myxococcales bacterium]